MPICAKATDTAVAAAPLRPGMDVVEPDPVGVVVVVEGCPVVGLLPEVGEVEVEVVEVLDDEDGVKPESALVAAAWVAACCAATCAL